MTTHHIPSAAFHGEPPYKPGDTRITIEASMAGLPAGAPMPATITVEGINEAFSGCCIHRQWEDITGWTYTAPSGLVLAIYND